MKLIINSPVSGVRQEIELTSEAILAIELEDGAEVQLRLMPSELAGWHRFEVHTHSRGLASMMLQPSSSNAISFLLPRVKGASAP